MLFVIFIVYRERHLLPNSVNLEIIPRAVFINSRYYRYCFASSFNNQE